MKNNPKLKSIIKEKQKYYMNKPKNERKKKDNTRFD